MDLINSCFFLAIKFIDSILFASAIHSSSHNLQVMAVGSAQLHLYWFVCWHKLSVLQFLPEQHPHKQDNQNK